MAGLQQRSRLYCDKTYVVWHVHELGLIGGWDCCTIIRLLKLLFTYYYIFDRYQINLIIHGTASLFSPIIFLCLWIGLNLVWGSVLYIYGGNFTYFSSGLYSKFTRKRKWLIDFLRVLYTDKIMLISAKSMTSYMDVSVRDENISF